MRHHPFFFMIILAASTCIYAVEMQPKTLYCPEVNAIEKKGLKWESTTLVKWKTFNASFGDGLKSFLGAQWSGVKVGSIICIYESTTPGVFPINLQNNHLFEQPTQENWKADREGVINCVSNKVTDCPLTPKIAQATPESNEAIIESLNINK